MSMTRVAGQKESSACSGIGRCFRTGQALFSLVGIRKGACPFPVPPQMRICPPGRAYLACMMPAEPGIPVLQGRIIPDHPEFKIHCYVLLYLICTVLDDFTAGGRVPYHPELPERSPPLICTGSMTCRGFSPQVVGEGMSETSWCNGRMFPYEVEELLNVDGVLDIQEMLDRLVRAREYAQGKVGDLGHDVRTLDLDNLPETTDQEQLYWLSFYKNLFNFLSIPLWVNGRVTRDEINSIRFDERCLYDIAEILHEIEQAA